MAHPDDLEYGCSAAIAAWTDGGREVAYVLATRGEAGIDTLEPAECGPLREREQRASAAVVGVSAVEFLDHRDGVIEYGPALRRDIAAAIRRHRPELVITLNHRDTWGGVAWNTPDHVAVGRATLDAAGDAGNRWIFPELVEQGLSPGTASAGSPSPVPHAHPRGGRAAGLERAVALAARTPRLHRGVDGRGARERTTCGDFLPAWPNRVGERFGGRPAVAFEVFPR